MSILPIPIALGKKGPMKIRMDSCVSFIQKEETFPESALQNAKKKPGVD